MIELIRVVGKDKRILQIAAEAAFDRLRREGYAVSMLGINGTIETCSSTSSGIGVRIAVEHIK